MRFAIDSVAHHRPADLKAAGIVGVLRYLSTSASKNMTLEEVTGLRAAGIPYALNWETSGVSYRQGYRGGVADGREANRQADALGHPRSRPIYYSADTNVLPGEFDALAEYLRGCAESGPRPIGVYCNNAAIEEMFVRGRCAYGWTSSSTSYLGNDHPPLHSSLLQRASKTLQLPLPDYDEDVVLTRDWGQDPAPRLYMMWKGISNDVRIWWSVLGSGGWSPQHTPPPDRTVGASFGVALAAYGEKLYLTWKGVGNDQGVYWITFNGRDWDHKQKVSGEVGTSVGPALAVFNDKLFMAWKGVSDDQGVYYSAFDGRNWFHKRIKVPGEVGSSVGPALAVYRAKLHMTFKGVGNDQQIYVTRFDGRNWDHKRQPVPGAVSAVGPALARFGGKLYMAWRGPKNSTRDDQGIYWTTYDGRGWDHPHPVPVRSSIGPALGVAGGKLHMTWKGEAGDPRIWQSTFTGGGWSTQAVVEGVGTSYRPTMADY